MYRLVGLMSLVLCGLLLAVSTGATQDKKGKAKGMLPAGWTKIGLSDEQKGKIYSIQSEFKAKAKNLEEQLAALKAAELTEMRKVLTEDQKTALAKVLLGDDAVKVKEKSKDKDKK